jgi:hypothetical protein
VAGFPAGWLLATWGLQALPMVRADGLDVADPEGQFLVGSCARWEKLLALGELVESGSGVVGGEVLDQDGDQQTCLGEAAFGQLAEQFAHRVALAVEAEVELPDPGPAGQDGVHLGVGRGPFQAGLRGEELPARRGQCVPVLVLAPVQRHAAPPVFPITARQLVLRAARRHRQEPPRLARRHRRQLQGR